MTDSKLDYPARPRRTGRNNTPALVPDSKLDLPGTLVEFNALSGNRKAALLSLRPFKKKESAEAVADAAGIARCVFGAPAIGWSWDIERMVVVGGGSAIAYVGGEQVSRIVDLTASGSGDVADENSPIYAEDGEVLSVVFSGVTPGVLCTANAQIIYRPGG